MIVPLRSKRQERAVLIQKLQHAIPCGMLFFAGLRAIGEGARGWPMALAVFEIVSSGLLAGSVIVAFNKARRPANAHHAPHLHHGGPDWIDIFTAALLFAEAAEHWYLKHHVARPTLVMAVTLLILGVFHGRIKRRAERRFTIRVEEHGLYVGGRPFRALREKWSDISGIEIDSRYATIRTRAGRTRRLDLSLLEGANHVRHALDEARRRLSIDEAKSQEA